MSKPRKAFSYRAGRPNRNSNFIFQGTDGDSHITNSGDLKRMREACRQLDRDNGIASSILDRVQENVIGKGLNIQILSGNKQWSDSFEKRFMEWWRYESDVRGMLSGPDMERLALRTHHVDGDVLAYLMPSGQVQHIEAHRIASPSHQRSTPTGMTIKHGVLLNKWGKPIKYHITQEGNDRGVIKTGTWLDADDCVVLGNYHRFSLTRGIPSFVPSLQQFEDLDAFVEASVISAKINAAACMAIIKQDGGAGAPDITTETDANGDSKQIQEWNPGMVEYLMPGEDIKVLSSTQQLVEFTQFVTQMLRFLGLPFGLPLEATSMDFSRTNYSSARAALQLAHKAFLVQHQKMVDRYMRPIVLWKMEQWVRERVIRPATGIVRVTATPPTMIQIDPQKEANANILNTQHGFSTNRQVAMSMGIDYEDMLNQRGREIVIAQRIAAKINKSNDTSVKWQDLLGDAKNYLADKGVGEPEPVETIPGDDTTPPVQDDDEPDPGTDNPPASDDDQDDKPGERKGQQDTKPGKGNK